MNLKQPQIAVTETDNLQELTVFTSSLSAVESDVSRQPSNSRGRERAPQGSLGIQASDRREVRSAILHHKPRRKGCSNISLRGMATDRGKTCRSLELQSDEEEISESDQLLRAGRGDG